MFYGAGLMWGRQTHLAMAEYWRWWVVHLWVEGFFEVFATVVIAFLFTRMGLLRIATATSSVMFSTMIFLGGGILGTMHHLVFQRHAHRRARAGGFIQCAGDCAAGVDRF
jgi:nitric oxide reductase subunit B